METPHGRAAVNWTRDGDAFTLEVTVLPSVEADVPLPDGAAHRAGSGTHRYACTLPAERFSSVPRPSPGERAAEGAGYRIPPYACAMGVFRLVIPRPSALG